MEITINYGNVHDIIAFDGLYEKLVERNPEIEAIVADAKEKYAIRYTLYRGLTQLTN